MDLGIAKATHAPSTHHCLSLAQFTPIISIICDIKSDMVIFAIIAWPSHCNNRKYKFAVLPNPSTKVQPLTPIISTTHYATKDCPWIVRIAQCRPYRSCNSSTTTAIHCWLRHNVQSHTKSIDRFYYLGGKTLKVQPCLNLLNLVSVCLLSGADYESTCIESLTFYLTEKDAKILVQLHV